MPEEKQFTPPEAPNTPFETEAARTVAESRETGARTERAETVADTAALKARASAIAPAREVVSERAKDPIYGEVEHVLEEGLMRYYQGMNPKVQKLFKERGEELAKTLAEMVQSAHVQLSKVVELIRRWLMLIPGVNRLFLEQEAKIRADRIAMIAELSAERRGKR